MLILNCVSSRLRAVRTWKAVALMCALLVLTPLITGCSQKGMAQAGTAQPEATSAGAPPDPMNQFSVFRFVLAPQMLVKRDALQLGNGVDAPDMLLTVSQPSTSENLITDEMNSLIAVVSYDATRRQWNQAWVSDVVPGTASPLPAANRADGYNGGKLLRTNDPILLLRTTTLNGLAHLYMWRWDAANHKGERLKVPDGDASERNADFQADLDVTVADLDSDGVYEVVTDNVLGVQTWKWDGSKYVPEGKLP